MILTNRFTFDPTGSIRALSVLLLGTALSALALIINLLLAGAAPALFGVPSDLRALGLGNLLLATLPAVLGNTLGFYLAYHSPHPRALWKFLIPAALFYGLFMIPPIWSLFTGSTLAAFAVAALINTVPVALAVPTFLSLRPNPVQKPRTPA